MSERILTKHPDERKQGVNIEKDKYNLIRNAIIKCLDNEIEMTFTDLTSNVKKELAPHFDGSIPWYVTTIKLDLEARKEIERIPDKQPQHLRIRQG